MTSILTLALKDLRLLFRDKMGLFFIVAFPVIMGVFFGLINRSFSSSEGRRAMQVGVVDADDSEMSRLFLAALAETKNIEVKPMERAAAMDQVRKGQLVGFIAIPSGFGETAGVMWLEGPALELGVDPSRQAESGMLQGMMMQAMGRLIQKRFTKPGAMRAQVQNWMANPASQSDMPPETHELLKGMMGRVDEFLGSMDDFSGPARRRRWQRRAENGIGPHRNGGCDAHAG